MKLRSLLAFAILLVSCDRRQPLVTIEPSMSNVVGRYSLTRYTFGEKLDTQIKAKADSAYIELNKDGTLLFHDVPIISERKNSPFLIQRFHSGNGTYSIAPLGSSSKSNFYGLYINCGSLPEPLGAPRLRGEKNSLTISFDYFNGDFVQRMAFTRTEKHIN